MQGHLKDRFEVNEILQKSKNRLTFLGLDRWNEDQPVVVKFVRASAYRPDSDLRERLVKLRGLNHPLVSDVNHAVVTPKRDFYMTRIFVEGTQLGSHDPALNETIVRSLVGAVSLLDTLGLVHGRLKPSNVIVKPERDVTVLDAAFPWNATQEDPAALSFTAPEVLQGSRPTFESDLYSLGALLFRTLTGVDLFLDPDPILLRHKCAYATPPRLHPRPDAPLALSTAVNGLLGSDPRSRRHAFGDLLSHLQVTPIAARNTPFFGRTDEQLRVSEALTPRSGLTVIFITSEPGGGKTRFLDHLQFLAELGGRPFLIGQSFERDNRPFEAVLRVIEHRLRRRDSRLKGWLREHGCHYNETLAYLLGDAGRDNTSKAPAPEEPPSRGKLVADLVGVLLTLFVADPSLTIAFDDLHWLDEGTLEVLEQLGWRAGEAGVRVLMLSRSNMHQRTFIELQQRWMNSHDITSEHLSLPPLSTEEAEQLAQLYAADEHQRHRLVDRAAGNPLLLHEYCHGDRDGGISPDSIRGIVIEQVQSLPGDLRLTAEAVSLFDRPASYKLLLALLTSGNVGSPEALDALIDCDLLRSSNSTVAFKHEAVRETVYRMISSKRRAILHRAAYEALKGAQVDAGAVAFHAGQARLYLVAAQLYWDAAGGRCAAEDFVSSIELFARAAEGYARAGSDAPADFVFSHGRALLGAGLHRRAEEQFLKWLSMAGRDARKSVLCSLLLASCKFDNPDEALRYVKNATGHQPPASSQVLPLLHLAQAYAMCGRLREAGSILASSESRVGQRTSEEAGRSAIIRLSLCDYRAALAAFDHVTVSDAVSARVDTNRAVCLEHLGQVRSAVVVQSKALEVAKRFGLLSVELQSLANLAAFACKRGLSEESEAYFRSAFRFCDTVRIGSRNDWFTMPILSSDRAVYFVETGEYGLSLSAIRAALKYSANDRSSQNAIWLAIKAAEIFRRTFDERRATAALRRVEQSEIFHCNFFVVERALIARSGESMTDERRLSQLEECLPLTEQMETLYQQCRVLIEVGQTLLRLGRRELCRQRLAEARTLAVKNGYAPLAARIDLLAALASDSIRERGRLLQRAYRRSTRMGLAELTAECAFRIGESHANRNRLKSALDYLRKSVASVDDMSEELPDLLRKRYLAGTWHADARSLMQQVETEFRKTERRKISAPADVQADPLFRRTYHTAVRMNRAKGIDEVIDILGHTLAKGLQLKLIVFLTARGDREFHSFGKVVDKQVENTIRKLDRTGKDEPFFALPSPHKGSHGALEAWMPLSFQRHRFGGLYVNMPKPPTEREIEFLTTLTASAATTLAALLWSADPPPDTSAVPGYRGIVGRSAAIRDICSQIEIAARSGATALIEGESGTGKELVARAIHENGSRSNGPFVAVDCGAIPETLIESELFGSCRGSFTGATTDRIGLIEASNKGTLFLDEISNTSPAVQAKLLRVLQEREVRRLGDTRGRKVDSRLIAATNADLDVLVTRSEFRQDLLYRLNVLHIRIPPLRQRREDIPEIAQAFLKRMNGEHGTRKRFHSSALASLAQGTYRGNVRELQNVIERAYFSSPGQDVIKEIAVGAKGDTTDATDAEGWFDRIASGKDDFWKAVHHPYKSRDISREKVRALMDVGLRETRGSYKNLAKVLHVDEREYRRFMDFLRRNDCQPDFRLYRRRPDRNRRQEPPEATAG